MEEKEQELNVDKFYIIHLLNGQLLFGTHKGIMGQQEYYTFHDVLTLMQTKDSKQPTITKATPLYNITDTFRLQDRAMAFSYPMDVTHRNMYEQAVQKFRASESNLILTKDFPTEKIF